jgi:alpha-D-xyloside xylohydrolase
MRARSVYLPATAGGWYDFWSGELRKGGRSIDAAAPFDSIPVHVRAGSIVPTGPDRQYATEKVDGPITVRVYTGADGAFSLYEDDGLSYDYEHGAFARIPLRWNEATGTLTIGAREGSYSGMPSELAFQVVFVTPDRPVGFSFDPKSDQTVTYRGDAVTVQMSGQ